MSKRGGLLVGSITLFVSPFLMLASLAAAEVLEEVVERKYVLEPDATLSIHNTDGSIRVYAAQVKEMSLQAIKKAYTLERLEGIIIDIKADRQHVSVNTVFPPKKSNLSLGDRSGTVEYTLIVPERTKITNLDLVNGEVLIEGLHGGSATVHLVNGWLGAHNSFADLDLTIVNGHLDVAYDWWEGTTFSAKAFSTNANISALLPSDASVDIAAQTVTGNIANGFASSKEKGGTVRSLEVSIGTDAGSQFNLGTTHGNIAIEQSY